MSSILFRIRRRRKKLNLAELFLPSLKVSLLQCCTGFLLVSSAIALHVSLVRYVDDTYRPEPANSVVFPAEAHVQLDGEERSAAEETRSYGMQEKQDQGLTRQGGRKLMSEEAEEATTESSGSTPTKIALESDRIQPDSTKSCRNGHIQGLAAVCDSLPCLRLLQRPIFSDTLVPRGKPLDPEQLRKLHRIPGSLDPLHYTLLPFLTEMQWSMDVFGAVGEIGVAMGKFTALLSLNIDVEAGERIFVSDPFNCSAVSFPGLSHYQIFSAHLRDFGFEEQSPRPEEKIFVHRGPPSEAIKRLLLEWDLPRFRLISVTSDRNEKVLLLGLELAACLLRDGGIIVVDGNDDPATLDVVLSTVSVFLTKNGHSAIVPLFAAGHKLFLTTTNWKRTYTEYFRKNEISLIPLIVADSAYTVFGKDVFVVR